MALSLINQHTEKQTLRFYIINKQDWSRETSLPNKLSLYCCSTKSSPFVFLYTYIHICTADKTQYTQYDYSVQSTDSRLDWVLFKITQIWPLLVTCRLQSYTRLVMRHIKRSMRKLEVWPKEVSYHVLLKNQHILRKRLWCFYLKPHDKTMELSTEKHMYFVHNW